jgi:type I restriction enzyme S subunit
MTEWREYRLSDIMDIISGGTPKTSVPEYWSGNIPWLSVADFNNVNRYVYDTEKHISELGLKNSSTKILKKGQLIISARGTVGALAQLKRDMAFNQSCYGLNANSLTTNDFLFYLLKYCIAELKQQSSGGVFDTIIRETFDNISVFLPPLPEQKAIADVLSSLDDKIDLLTRQNKTLEDLAQAYFRKWFIEDIHNKICYKRFADVAEFSKGKKPREIIEEQRKGYVRQILIDTFDTDKEYYTRPEGMIISTETDILMVMDGASSGRVEIGFSGVVGSTIGMFRPKSDFKYPMFLYEFLKSNEEFIMDNTTGSAIPHADKKLIFELEIPYFQEEKIQEFENFALVLFNKRQNNRRQIRTLTKLRDTLLPKLISGEIRVKM